MNPEQIKIEQEYYENIFVGPVEKDIVQIWQVHHHIDIERQNIKQLIEILTEEIKPKP